MEANLSLVQEHFHINFIFFSKVLVPVVSDGHTLQVARRPMLVNLATRSMQGMFGASVSEMVLGWHCTVSRSVQMSTWTQIGTQCKMDKQKRSSSSQHVKLCAIYTLGACRACLGRAQYYILLGKDHRSLEANIEPVHDIPQSRVI